LISEKFGTNHKEFVISHNDVTNALPEMVEKSAEPIPHVVSVFIHHLAKREEREKIELVLDGLGPDELFCGYVNYPWVFGAHQIAKYLRISPSKRLRHFFAEGMGRVGRNIITEFLPDVLESEDGVPFWSIGFSETERKKLLTFKLQRSSYSFLKHENLFKMNFDEFHQTLKSLEFKHRLPDKFFREVEYLGSPSIDVAFPFLDYTLIDYALTIPSSMNMKVSTGKYLFKKAMTGILPRAILERKKKIGFGGHFSRDPSFLKSLFGAIEEEMDKSDFSKFFDKARIQELLRRPVANVEKLWLLLNLTLWYNNWILEA
jgi:asparagine synthase (glutamine-hydrolysing)